MAMTASINTFAKRPDYRPASTMTGASANWVPSVPSAMFAESSACSTSPGFALKVKAVRMRTLDGWRISLDPRCGLKRPRKSWSVSVLSFEKSRSGRRSASASGGMNVAGVVGSCEAAIVAEEGDRFIRLPLPTKSATFLRALHFHCGGVLGPVSVFGFVYWRSLKTAVEIPIPSFHIASGI